MKNANKLRLKQVRHIANRKKHKRDIFVKRHKQVYDALKDSGALVDTYSTVNSEWDTTDNPVILNGAKICE